MAQIVEPMDILTTLRERGTMKSKDAGIFAVAAPANTAVGLVIIFWLDFVLAPVAILKIVGTSCAC